MNSSTRPKRACKRCGEAKPVEAFELTRHGNPRALCRTCRNVDRRAAKTNEKRAVDLARNQRWRATNRERHLEQKRNESEHRRRRQGARSQVELIAEASKKKAEQQKQRAVRTQAEREQRLRLTPWSDPALSAAERFALRYRLDPEFNLKQRLRAHLRRKRQGIRIGDLLRTAIVRQGRSSRVEQFLGYSAADLKLHLERQFTRGMTWAAFAAGEIHIDHRVPLASFDLSKPDELRAAWAMTNLQPLWADANRAKAAKRALLV